MRLRFSSQVKWLVQSHTVNILKLRFKPEWSNSSSRALSIILAACWITLPMSHDHLKFSMCKKKLSSPFLLPSLPLTIHVSVSVLSFVTQVNSLEVILDSSSHQTRMSNQLPNLDILPPQNELHLSSSLIMWKPPKFKSSSVCYSLRIVHLFFFVMGSKLISPLSPLSSTHR